MENECTHYDDGSNSGGGDGTGSALEVIGVAGLLVSINVNAAVGKEQKKVGE